MSSVEFVAGVSPLADDDASAFWFLVRGDQLLVIEDADAVSVPRWSDVCAHDIPIVRSQYLGALTNGAGSVACYSAEIAEQAPLPQGFAVLDLRQLFERMDGVTAGIASRAKQIVAWDRDHQFCGRCAAPMETMTGERAKRCPACGLTNYPRISPAMIVAVTRQFPDGERILLARNHRFPTGRYSVVAGFVEPGETLEDCVRREVREEVGIEVANIRYFGSQPWPFPNSLMVGFTAEYASGEFRLEEAEIADAQWFAADKLPLLPPKISIARRLIDAFAARGQ